MNCEGPEVGQAQGGHFEKSPSAEPSANELIASALQKGARLRSENGELKYSVRKGQLSEAEINALKQNRLRILASLGNSENCEPTKRAHGRSFAPLSYSQHAHWNLYNLSERPSGCIVSSAIRIHGELDAHALYRSVAANVRRHEALRTRIVKCDKTLVQEIADSDAFEFGVGDFTGGSGADVMNVVDKYIIGPVRLTHDPLFRCYLARLTKEDHVFVLSAEHIISDACSMDILLSDIMTGYAQAVRGHPIQLPTVQIQFADYAAWLRSREAPLLERLTPYWNKYLRAWPRVRLPGDKIVDEGRPAGWGASLFRIDKELREGLRNWCRARRTTAVIAAFAVFTCVVLRWCRQSEAVFLYQTSGRFNPAIRNTIGYFATPIYIRMRCGDEDTLADILSRATEEYCRALEYRDMSYLEGLDNRPEFTRNSCFNWIQNAGDSERVYSRDSGAGISYSRAPLDLSGPNILERDTEPIVIFVDDSEEISGAIQFPKHRFSSACMQRFGSDILEFLRMLILYPERKVIDIVLTC